MKARHVICAAAVTFAIWNVRSEDGYIESDGTQFVNTGYHPNPNTKLVLDYALTDASESGGNIGATLMSVEQWTSATSLSTTLCVSSKNGQGLLFSLGDGTSFFGRSALFDTERRSFTFDLPSKTMSAEKNGSVVCSEVSPLTVSNTSTMPLGLFGKPNNLAGTASAGNSKMRVYGLKIYESGALIHDFVPAVKGGSAGLYDQKTGSFLQNTCVIDKAISEFTSGGNIREVTDDAFIESDGRQFLNTGYNCNPNTKIVLDYSLTDVSDRTCSDGGNLTARILGAEEWSSKGLMTTLYFHSAKTENAVRVVIGDAWNNNDSVKMSYNLQRRTVTMDLPNGFVFVTQNGLTNGLYSVMQDKWKPTRGVTASFPLCLFGKPNNAAGTAWVNCSKVRIYSLKIYESGELVRDFEPYIRNGVAGLRETVDGGFYSSLPLVSFACGGNISSDGSDDAYLSATQRQMINTGYLANPQSRIEVDFAMNSHTNRQERVFGATYGAAAGKLTYGLYGNGDADGDGCFSFLVYNGDSFGYYASSTKVDLQRHTAVADLKNGTWSLITGSTTNTYATKAVTTTADYPMGIFGTPTSKDGSTGGSLADMRVYAVRIYENDSLVHHFLPYKDDAKVGLLDVVTGTVRSDVLSSGVPFTVGGCGWGGEHAAFYSEPESCTAKYDNPATLRAFAPGAKKYQWYCGDNPLAGETKSELTVSYVRRTESLNYRVKATFDVNGVEVERMSSAATVKMIGRGIVLVVR